MMNPCSRLRHAYASLVCVAWLLLAACQASPSPANGVDASAGVAVAAAPPDAATDGYAYVPGGGNTTVPGPPRLLSAFVVTDDLRSSCDYYDPRSWSDGFPAHPRCFPDLLNTAEATLAYPANASLLLVFSEKLDPGPISPTIGPDVVSIQVPGVALPIVAQGSYSPYGRDFRQGLTGTGPPGPSLQMALGLPTISSLPTGRTAQVCLNPAYIADLSGDRLADDPAARCFSMVTAPLRPLTFSPPEGSTVTVSDVLLGLYVEFNGPLAATVSTGDVDVRFAGAAVSAGCYQVSASPSDPPQLWILVFDNVSHPSCPRPSPGIAAVTLRATITDAYGTPLGSNVVWQFTVTP
jgi:hypothetical protein